MASKTNAEWQVEARIFDGIEMVLVPAGYFTMGSTDEQLDYGETFDVERRWLFTKTPAHKICFADAFWIDKYEVTNAQYGSIGCAEYSNAPDEPRNCVTWVEANSFCQTRQTRLPTESEWEYAARGPNNWIFPWGNELNINAVNYNVNELSFVDGSDMHTESVGSRVEDTSWVGALEMAGNVAEWTSTVFLGYPYTSDIFHENPDNSTNYRTVRGGAYQTITFTLRSAYRIREKPDSVYEYVGFRCARDFE